NVVRADIEETSAEFARGTSDVFRSRGVDSVGKLWVPLGAVHISIGSGQNDPIRFCAGEQLADLFQVADVRVLHVRRDKLVVRPLSKDVAAEHAVGTDE